MNPAPSKIQILGSNMRSAMEVIMLGCEKQHEYKEGAG